MKKLVLILFLVSFVSACCSTSTQEPAVGGQQDSEVGTTMEQPSDVVEPDVVEPDVVEPDVVEPDVVEETMSAIIDAIKSGTAYKCTYRGEGFETEAIFKGDKFHYKTAMEGDIAYSVSDGEWMYTWMDGQSTGTKFRIADMEDSAEVEESEVYTDVAGLAEADIEIDCNPTVVSDDIFRPPAGVEFNDLSQLMKQLDEGEMNLCSLCNMIPDEDAKQECMEEYC